MDMGHGQMTTDQMAQKDANGQMIPGHQHMGPHMKNEREASFPFRRLGEGG